MNRSINKQIVIIHFLFWTVYFFFFLFQLSSPFDDEPHFRGKPKMMLLPPSQDFIQENHVIHLDSVHHRNKPTFGVILVDVILHVLLMMGMAYANYLFLLPRFLANKDNRLSYFLKVALLFLVSVVALILIKSLARGEFLAIEHSMFYRKSFIIELSLSAMFILLFVSLLKFVENYVEVEAQKKEIENQQLRTELMLLKSQINPHFLFNAFNNLYALAIQNSKETPAIIEKLSQIMRYTLYESSKSEVALEKEIALIENMIALERLHLGNEGTIIFEKNNSLQAEKVKIAPMILVTFLENAFKHGSKGAKTHVEIHLELQNNVLIYEVKNRKDEHANLLEKSGIGLKNVKRQLELYYHQKHTLYIQEDEQNYGIELKINIL